MGRYLEIADRAASQQNSHTSRKADTGLANSPSRDPAAKIENKGYDKNDINDKSPCLRPITLPASSYDINDKSPKEETRSPASRDWMELFEKRAAIREFDGRWPRPVAERLAYGEVVEAWCRRHPRLPGPETCAGCGQRLVGCGLPLPDGAHVHFEDATYKCLIAYGTRRKQRAVEQFAAFGLAPPPGWAVA